MDANQLCCPICFQYFDNVVETTCCGQGYCLSCLRSAVEVSGTCPSCRHSLEIASCTPNRMIQRMVDNLPMECPYTGCSAKLTRGVLREHVDKCDYRPGVQIGDTCPVHAQPMTIFCSQDGLYVCPLCALVGQHRHHSCGSMKGAYENIAGLSVELGLVNSFSVFHWLREAYHEMHSLSTGLKISNSIGSAAPPMSSTDPSASLKQGCLAAIFCQMNSIPVTYKNISKVVEAAGPVGDQVDDLLHLIENEQALPSSPTHRFLSSLSPETRDVSSALGGKEMTVEEFEDLKKTYKSENFDFNGIRIRAVPSCPVLIRGVENHVYALLEIKCGAREVHNTETNTLTAEQEVSVPTNLYIAEKAESGGEDEEGERSEVALDLVFVVDCTGSMGGVIRTVQDNIRNIVQKIILSEKADVRFGLVMYKDFPQKNSKDKYVTCVKDFTSDKEEMERNVNEMEASGGGDGPEALATGLYDVLNMPYRKNVTKVVILATDAPPHGLEESGDSFPDGDPSGHDPIDIVRRMADQNIILYCVGCNVSPKNSAFLRFESQFTGGRYVPVSNAALLSEIIIGGCREELSMYRQHDIVLSLLEKLENEQMNKEEAIEEAMKLLKQQGIEITKLKFQESEEADEFPVKMFEDVQNLNEFVMILMNSKNLPLQDKKTIYEAEYKSQKALKKVDSKNAKKSIPKSVPPRVDKIVNEDGSVRKALALAIVLDSSGSMNGLKLRTCKEAILKVINGLKEGDVLHLIEYGTHSKVAFANGTSSHAPLLVEAVEQIKAGGCTNISTALDDAFNLLAEDVRPIKRIFLFSDGCANLGVTSTDGIVRIIQNMQGSSVGVSAFGIGADFDERMMKAIARAGRGHYFFIDSPLKIPLLLQKAYIGMGRTMAGNVLFKIEGTKGRKVTKVAHTGEENIPLELGSPLGDIRERDYKQILVQLDVFVDANNNEKEEEVIKYELHYDKLDDSLPIAPLIGSLKLQITDDYSQLSEEKEVLVFLRLHEAAEIDQLIGNLLTEKKLDRAIQLKEKAIQILAEVKEHDKLGFVQVLLSKAYARLAELQDLKKAQNVSSATYHASYERAKKGAYKDMDEECDDDMGFALFD